MAKTLLFSALLFVAVSSCALAQLTVTFPTSRAVFQRDNANQATLSIGGYFEACLDRIEARVIPRSSGQGTATEWTPIQSNPTGGQFYGALPATGGWYTLEVRGILGNAVVASSAVDRVGIGEVFLVAGQSNASGGSFLPSGGRATDDRVNSVNFKNTNPNNGTVPTYAESRLPGPEFVHLEADIKMAPFGNNAWCWSTLGDSLARRLNVPVMIFNAAWAGSEMLNWRQSIDPNSSTTSEFEYSYPAGMPFGNIRLSLHNYLAQLGCRAILWHQGEGDNSTERTREYYRDGLRAIIEATRSLSGKADLAWVVARVSRMTKDGVSRTWQPVIDAQNDVIGLNNRNPGVYLPNVFAGPETDPMAGPAFRPFDGIHFSGNGLPALGQAWASSLNASFFSSSHPYLATPPPMVAAQCAGGGNQLAFQAPAGFTSYQWVPEDDCNFIQSTQSTWTTTTGTYRLKAKDALQNTVLSPVLRVPASTAIEVSASGTTSVVVGDTLLLQSSSTTACSIAWSGPNGYTGATAQVKLTHVQPNQAGTYTAKVTNLYGCQAQSTVEVAVLTTVESRVSGNWNSTTTWSCGCLPNAATDVKIRQGTTVTVDRAVHAKSILQEGVLQLLTGGNLLFSQ